MLPRCSKTRTHRWPSRARLSRASSSCWRRTDPCPHMRCTLPAACSNTSQVQPCRCPWRSHVTDRAGVFVVVPGMNGAGDMHCLLACRLYRFTAIDTSTCACTNELPSSLATDMCCACRHGHTDSPPPVRLSMPRARCKAVSALERTVQQRCTGAGCKLWSRAHWRSTGMTYRMEEGRVFADWAATAAARRHMGGLFAADVQRVAHRLPNWTGSFTEMWGRTIRSASLSSRMQGQRRVRRRLRAAASARLRRT